MSGKRHLSRRTAGASLRRTAEANLRRTAGASLRRTAEANLRRTAGASLRRTACAVLTAVLVLNIALPYAARAADYTDSGGTEAANASKSTEAGVSEEAKTNASGELFSNEKRSVEDPASSGVKTESTKSTESTESTECAESTESAESAEGAESTENAGNAPDASGAGKTDPAESEINAAAVSDPESALSDAAVMSDTEGADSVKSSQSDTVESNSAGSALSDASVASDAEGTGSSESVQSDTDGTDSAESVLSDPEKPGSTESSLSEAEVTKSEEKEKIVDAAIETYLLEHADEKYVGKKDDMQLANILYVLQTLFESSSLPKNATIDSVMDDVNTFGGWLGTYEAPVPVYLMSADSPYLVAYANTMQDDRRASVRDVVYARNNSDGEVLKGAVYDRNTGIVYIPVSMYADKSDPDKQDIGNLRMQILQSVNTSQGSTQVSSSYKSVINADGKLDVSRDSDNILESETTVQAKKGLSTSKLEVAVNGIPLDASLWTYNAATGVVTISASSASVASVTVTEDGTSVLETIEDALGVSDVYAITADSMQNAYKTMDPVVLPEGTAKGDSFYSSRLILYKTHFYEGEPWGRSHGISKYVTEHPDEAGVTYPYSYSFGMYASKNAKEWDKDTTNKKASKVQKLIRAICSGEKFSYSDVIYEPDYYTQLIDFDNSNNRPFTHYKSLDENGKAITPGLEGGAVEEDEQADFTSLREVCLTCSHISSPLGTATITKSSSSWIEASDYLEGVISEARRTKTVVRVFDLNMKKKYAILGILTARGSKNLETGQTGTAIVKVPYKADGKTTITVNKRSANTFTAGNDCYSLKDAEYAIFEDEATAKAVDAKLTKGTYKVEDAENAAGKGNYKKTDSSGSLTFRNLTPNRTYYIVEISPSEGFLRNTGYVAKKPVKTGKTSGTNNDSDDENEVEVEDDPEYAEIFGSYVDIGISWQADGITQASESSVRKGQTYTINTDFFRALGEDLPTYTNADGTEYLYTLDHATVNGVTKKSGDTYTAPADDPADESAKDVIVFYFVKTGNDTPVTAEDDGSSETDTGSAFVIVKGFYGENADGKAKQFYGGSDGKVVRVSRSAFTLDNDLFISITNEEPPSGYVLSAVTSQIGTQSGMIDFSDLEPAEGSPETADRTKIPELDFYFTPSAFSSIPDSNKLLSTETALSAPIGLLLTKIDSKTGENVRRVGQR